MKRSPRGIHEGNNPARKSEGFHGIPAEWGQSAASDGLVANAMEAGSGSRAQEPADGHAGDEGSRQQTEDPEASSAAYK